MSKSFFTDVVAFHDQFGLKGLQTPGLLSPDILEMRLKLIYEELDEFVQAHAVGDLYEVLDALVDLTWVVLGTAHLAGMPFEAGWLEVRRANMSKVRATHANESKRGSSLDIIKPPGWVGPDHTAALANNTRTEYQLDLEDFILQSATQAKEY
jgi:predicted HAD superfamily Cof-like phosphohydrolase